MMSRRLALVLFLARLMRKPLPMSMKSLLPVMAAKRLPPICSKIVFAIIFVVFRCYVVAVRTPPQCSKFCFLGYGCASFQPLSQTLHVVLARYDCRMAVNGGETAAFIAVYPPLQGINSPRFRIVKDAVQCLDRLAESDDQCLVACHVHRLPSFPSFAVSHLSRAVRHSSNVGLTQENNSPSVWR